MRGEDRLYVAPEGPGRAAGETHGGGPGSGPLERLPALSWRERGGWPLILRLELHPSSWMDVLRRAIREGRRLYGCRRG